MRTDSTQLYWFSQLIYYYTISFELQNESGIIAHETASCCKMCPCFYFLSDKNHKLVTGPLYDRLI